MAVDLQPISTEAIQVGQTVVLSQVATMAVTAVVVAGQVVTITGVVQGGPIDGVSVSMRMLKGPATVYGGANLQITRPAAGSVRKLVSDGSVWAVSASGAGFCVIAGTGWMEGDSVPSLSALGPTVAYAPS